jgi:hypothetical protein
MSMARSTRGRDEKYIQNLIGKPEGKRPRGRPRRRWEDNIRMDLRERRCKGVSWMHLALVETVKNLRVP